MVIIDEKPNVELPDVELVIQALNNLEENGYLIEEEAIELLKYVVYSTRQCLRNLGIDIKNNSLDGFCELTQSLSIRPLEKLGLKVTKNLAQIDFNYDMNHSYGTVSIPVKIGDIVILKNYLIDITYRQFFMDNGIEEYNVNLSPYIENEDVAKFIMINGYVELNDEIARLYGKPFSSFSNNDEDINYYNNIINSQNDYAMTLEDMEGLNIEFPNYKAKIK